MSTTINKSDKDIQDILDDYNFSRHNYYKLLKISMEVIDKLIELSENTEHPRVYEALAGIIKNTGDMNDKFVNLQRKKQNITKEEGIKRLQEGPIEGGELETISTENLLKAIEESSSTSIISKNNK